MSLDLWLEVDGPPLVVEPHDEIFIRRDGETIEISRAEWDHLYPGRDPVTIRGITTNQVYDCNITHNLAPMAEAAGLYFLWHPEDHKIERAEQMVPMIEAGLQKLRENPVAMKTFNPANGWGSYEGLIRFAEGILDACRLNPSARVRTWA